MLNKNILLMPKFRESSYLDYNFLEEFNKENTKNSNSISYDINLENSIKDIVKSMQNNEQSVDYPFEIIDDDDDFIQEKKSDNKINEGKKPVSKIKYSCSVFPAIKKTNKNLNKSRKRKKKFQY